VTSLQRGGGGGGEGRGRGRGGEGKGRGGEGEGRGEINEYRQVQEVVQNVIEDREWGRV